MFRISWSHLRHDSRVLYAVAIAFVVLVAGTDLGTWIDLDVASVFGLPLLLAALTRNRRLLWTLTVVLAITTFVVYALQVPPGAFGLHEAHFVNRSLDVVGLFLTASLLHVWIRSVEVREAQMRTLDEQNRALEAANAELRVREAQIARQSAELDVRRREAEEASGRKTRLLASVSHDIRTPLSSIQLMSDVIRRTARDPKLATQVPGMVERLQHNAASLMEVVSDLLDLSYFESGRVECHASRFALGELVGAKCDDVLPLAQAKMLRIEIDAPSAPLHVMTDRAKLGRVVTNLLTNAIKFTPAGTIRVTIARDDEGAPRITVADPGIGIAPEKLDRIFDEYARFHGDSAEQSEGWGLGLAISRRLVDMLAGTISARSTPGLGSEFSVRLPASCLVDERAPTLVSSPGVGVATPPPSQAPLL